MHIDNLTMFDLIFGVCTPNSTYYPMQRSVIRNIAQNIMWILIQGSVLLKMNVYSKLVSNCPESADPGACVREPACEAQLGVKCIVLVFSV